MKRLSSLLIVNVAALLLLTEMHSRGAVPGYGLSLAGVAALVVFDLIMILRARKIELISTPVWQFVLQHFLLVLFCCVCILTAVASIPALVTGRSSASDMRQALVGAGLGGFILFILRRAWNKGVTKRSRDLTS